MILAYILIVLSLGCDVYLLFFKKSPNEKINDDLKEKLDSKPTILISEEENIDSVLVDPKRENKIIYTLLKKEK